MPESEVVLNPFANAKVHVRHRFIGEEDEIKDGYKSDVGNALPVDVLDLEGIVDVAVTNTVLTAWISLYLTLRYSAIASQFTTHNIAEACVTAVVAFFVPMTAWMTFLYPADW